jgi:hypothetical protein
LKAKTGEKEHPSFGDHSCEAQMRLFFWKFPVTTQEYSENVNDTIKQDITNLRTGVAPGT